MQREWGTYGSSLVEGKYEVERLLSIAQEAVESKTTGSKMLVKTPERTVPRFLHSGTFQLWKLLELIQYHSLCFKFNDLR
jgi:hypothetical protein